jgi:N-acetylglucosamine-6-phosphate deacetylase
MSEQRGHLTIRGGSIIGIADGGVRRSDIAISAGQVTQVTDVGLDDSGPTLDASGCHVVPGFIDTQVNGAFGIDLTNEPHRIEEVAAQLPQFGVTAFCPTVITGPVHAVPDALRAVHAARRARSQNPTPATRVLGLHAEGPFLAPARRGTHPLEHIRPPSSNEVQTWIDLASQGGTSSALSMVTLAPELAGAREIIGLLVEAGLTVCAGHTEASASTLAAAEDQGVTAVTHLFNAMPQMGHRSPGTVGGTLASKELIACLIADGLHVDPLVIDVAWSILGPRRTVLVSDSIAALGVGDGQYDLGGVRVEVRSGTATNPDGALAGSTLSMDQAVRNLIEYTGCTLHDACRAASTNPARLVGSAAAGLGNIARNQLGDVVVLDEALQVAATIIDGVVVHDPQSRLARHS